MEATFDQSRRTFLKGIAAVGAGLAAASVTGGTASAKEQSTSADQEADNASTDRPFTTYVSDVVVVGGGVMGMLAARNALKHGKTVTLLDKGPLGHSGASGINWGHHTTSYENATDEDIETWIATGVNMSDGVLNQDYLEAMCNASRDLKLYEVMHEIGCVVERSPEDGTVASMPKGSEGNEDGLFPRMMAQYIRRSGVRVLDRTMVIDLLQSSDGSAAGVVGINMLNGDAVVVRGKAFVFATGSGVWCNGWTGTRAKTDGSPESTGDGTAIMLSHGLAFSNLEFQWPYWYNLVPDGIAYSQGIGMLILDHNECWSNSEGEHFFENSQAWADRPTNCTDWKLQMKQIYDGKGSPHGGLFYEGITHFAEPQYVMRFNRRIPENIDRAFDYQLLDKIEMGTVPFDGWAMPKVDKKCATDIPGLYTCSPTSGAITFATAGGHLCGGSAAEYADTAELKDINLETVQEILNNAYGALENNNTGKRANEVQHEIQQVCNTYLWPARTDEGLNAAIEELNRIKQEDIPNMVVTSKSRTFNWEWRQAMEVPFMWTFAMAKIHACLARKETRCFNHRLDYPNMDNENFLKEVFVSLKDGEFTSELTDIVDTHIPVDQVREMVPEIGIGDYPQK